MYINKAKNTHISAAISNLLLFREHPLETLLSQNNPRLIKSV